MNKLYNFWLISSLLIATVTLQAQNVGIGTNAPHTSAKLHIVDANRGILIPQVSIGNVVLAAPVTTPATGLLVWNTNAAVTGGSGQGFYYWDGTQWVQLGPGDHNTLDMAYDEGGPGAGRVIVADAGTVEINGTGGLWVNATTTTVSSAIQSNNTNGTNNSDVKISYIGNSAGNVVAQGVRSVTSFTGSTATFDGGYGVYGVVKHPTDGTLNIGGAAGSNNKALGIGGSIGSNSSYIGGPKDMIAAVWGGTGLHNSGKGSVTGGAKLYAGLFSGNGRTLGLWGENSTYIEMLPKWQTSDYDAGVVGFYNASAGGGNNNADIGTGDNYLSIEANVTDATQKHVTLQTRTNGNVGIGTASPTEKLHVAGGTRITSLSGVNNRLVQSNATGVVSNVADGTAGQVLTTDGVGGLTWQNSVAGSWDILGNAGTIPTTNFLGTTDAQDLVFRTNNVENMRVNINGNVGIGTTSDIARLYTYIPSTDATTNYGIYNNHSGTDNGTKYGHYNNVSSAGTGARYGIYSLTYQNSASNSTTYGMRNYLRSYGTGTNYGAYNYNYTTGTGTHYALYNYMYLSGTTVSANTYGAYNNLQVASSTNTSTLYGEYTNVDYSAGTRYGEYKAMNSNVTYDGDVYADYNRLYGTGDGVNYGVYNAMEATGTGTKYGTYSLFPATAIGVSYGAYNNFDATNTSAKYGYYNNFTAATSGTSYGLYNNFANTTTATKYGVRNYFSDVGGVKYGVHNYIPGGTSSSTIYGLYNQFYADNNSTIYGVRDYLYYLDGTGTKYGVRNYLYNNNGTQYGTYNYVYGKSTSASPQYGVYSYVNTNGTGTHYALYADASGGTNDFAAVFNAGNVVANEIGGNYDFRVEGDTETNLVMVDASADRVGIGRATPTYRLDVYDPNTAMQTYVYRGRNGTATGTRTQIGSVEYFVDQSSTIDYTGGSNFSINLNAAAAYDLQLSINSAAKPGSNVWTVASDRRLKDDINPFKDGLETLRGIEPVYFKYNGKANIKEDHYFVGVVAQELEQVAPYMVGSYESAPGDIPFEEQEAATQTYKSVDNGAMTYVAINAIKELDAQQTKVRETFKNISDFGVASLTATETFVPFNSDFKTMLTGLPVVAVTAINSAASLTIVSQTTEGFTVRMNGEFANTDFNWVAMAKVKEEALNTPRNYTEAERQEMLNKVKAEEAEINYEREYEEIEIRKQEAAAEAAARGAQDAVAKQAEADALEANVVQDKEANSEEMKQNSAQVLKDKKAATKAAEKTLKAVQAEEKLEAAAAKEELEGATK